MPRFRRLPSLVGSLVFAGVITTTSVLTPIAASARPDPRPDPRVVATPEDPLRVLLMGDSLAFAAEDFFFQSVTANDDAVVDSNLVHGGTAICDWFPTLEAELSSFAPDVAVVLFSGNSLTPCMVDPATGEHYTGDAKVEKYRTDALAVMTIFDAFGVEVYWIGVPLPRGDTGAQEALNSMYRRLARRSASAHYLYAGAAVLDDGEYTDYLPCKAGEPCTDTDPATGEPAAQVRAPDGAHFCPDGTPAMGGVTQACTVWSSGAWRFGTSMAEGIIDAYGL